MAPIDTTYFTIDNLQFKWGTTFEEVEKALAVTNQYNFDSEEYTLEHTCDSVFNLIKTSVYNKNRHVFKLQYDLASIHHYNTETNFEPYLNPLVQILGKESIIEKGKYSSSETHYL